MKDNELPRFEVKRTNDDIPNFLDKLVNIGKITVVNIYGKEYLIYVENIVK